MVFLMVDDWLLFFGTLYFLLFLNQLNEAESGNHQCQWEFQYILNWLGTAMYHISSQIFWRIFPKI